MKGQEPHELVVTLSIHGVDRKHDQNVPNTSKANNAEVDFFRWEECERKRDRQRERERDCAKAFFFPYFILFLCVCESY